MNWRSVIAFALLVLALLPAFPVPAKAQSAITFRMYLDCTAPTPVLSMNPPSSEQPCNLPTGVYQLNATGIYSGGPLTIANGARINFTFTIYADPVNLYGSFGLKDQTTGQTIGSGSANGEGVAGTDCALATVLNYYAIALASAGLNPGDAILLFFSFTPVGGNVKFCGSMTNTVFDVRGTSSSTTSTSSTGSSTTTTSTTTTISSTTTTTSASPSLTSSTPSSSSTSTSSTSESSTMTTSETSTVTSTSSGCAPLTLTVHPGTWNLAQGTSGTLSVAVSSLTHCTVYLDINWAGGQAPSGVTVSFNPNSGPAPLFSDLTLKASATATPGTYTATVAARDDFQNIDYTTFTVIVSGQTSTQSTTSTTTSTFPIISGGGDELTTIEEVTAAGGVLGLIIFYAYRQRARQGSRQPDEGTESPAPQPQPSPPPPPPPTSSPPSAPPPTQPTQTDGVPPTTDQRDQLVTCCGPDITDNVLKAMVKLMDDFFSWSDSEQRTQFLLLVRPDTFQDAWDILQLSPPTADNPGYQATLFPYKKHCMKPEACYPSVEFLHNCHHPQVVNYIEWGVISRLSEWRKQADGSESAKGVTDYSTSGLSDLHYLRSGTGVPKMTDENYQDQVAMASVGWMLADRYIQAKPSGKPYDYDGDQNDFRAILESKQNKARKQAACLKRCGPFIPKDRFDYMWGDVSDGKTYPGLMKRRFRP